MAVFQSTILGKVRGKVGDLSLYRLNGKQIARVQTSTVKGRVWSDSQESARVTQAARNLFMCTLYSIPQGYFAPGIRKNPFSEFQRLNLQSVQAAVAAYEDAQASLTILDPQAITWHYMYAQLVTELPSELPEGVFQYNPATSLVMQRGKYELNPVVQIQEGGFVFQMIISEEAYAQFDHGYLWLIITNSTSGIAFSQISIDSITTWSHISRHYVAEFTKSDLPAGNIIIVPKIYYKDRKGSNTSLCIVNIQG